MLPFRFRFSNALPFYPTKSISHLLIAVSVVVAILWSQFQVLIGYFGLHRIPFHPETIPFILGQLFLYQFLHGSALHILMNSIFLYQAGPEVEAGMTRKKFITFFLANSLFVAVCLWIFSSWVTIGISGFCMALLSYLYMDLQKRWNPSANQVLIMLVINVALGLSSDISFVGHAAGAVFGVVWWMYRR